jgi:hypothetical protein
MTNGTIAFAPAIVACNLFCFVSGQAKKGFIAVQELPVPIGDENSVTHLVEQSFEKLQIN